MSAVLELETIPVTPAEGAPPIGRVLRVAAADVDALDSALIQQGFEVFPAPDAAGAHQRIDGMQPDAILVDEGIAGGAGATGFECAVQLAHRLPEVPVTLMVASVALPAAVLALNRGDLHRLLVKPVEAEAVARQIADDLTRLRTQRRQLHLMVEHERMRQDQFGMLRMLSAILEKRLGLEGACSREVGALIRALGPAVGLSGDSLRDALYAGLLEDMGKIALPDALLGKHLHELSGEQREVFLRHPQIGEAYLHTIHALRGAGRILRSLYEQYDGNGMPERLAGHAIPAGSRLLRVVSDYIRYRHGVEPLVEDASPHTVERTLAWLEEGRNRLYDPAMLDALVQYLARVHGEQRPSIVLSIWQLQPGMVLARDLISPTGMLLLSQDHGIDANQIRQFLAYEEASGKRMKAHVYAPTATTARQPEAPAGGAPA